MEEFEKNTGQEKLNRIEELQNDLWKVYMDIESEEGECHMKDGLNGKYFLGHHTNWIRVDTGEGGEHWTVIGMAYEKVFPNKPRPTSQEFLEAGLLRIDAGEEVLYVEGRVPMTQGQRKELKDYVIWKNIEPDGIVVDFKDSTYNEKMERVLCAY